MPVIPNIHFTLLVKVNGRLREFNFLKRSETLYETDTSDERGNRFVFMWREQQGQWIIESRDRHDLPAFITANRDAIEQAFALQLH